MEAPVKPTLNLRAFTIRAPTSSMLGGSSEVDVKVVAV
jgi:hypothetical protein